MYNKIKVPNNVKVETLLKWKLVIEDLILKMKGTDGLDDPIDSILSLDEKLPDTPLLVIDNSTSFDSRNTLSVNEAKRISDAIDSLNRKIEELNTNTEPDYLSYTGNNILCPATLLGRTKDMVIEGGTLFNYFSSYDGGTALTSDITLSPSGYRLMKMNLNSTLTPGTYTLYFTTLSKTTNKEIKVYGTDSKGFLYPSVDNTYVVNSGFSKATFIIPEARPLDNLYVYIDKDDTDSGILKMTSVMLLRGDYTGKKITHFVNGMQDSGNIVVASRNDNLILNGRFTDKVPNNRWTGFIPNHMDLSRGEFTLYMKENRAYTFYQKIDCVEGGKTYHVNFNYMLQDFAGKNLEVRVTFYQDDHYLSQKSILLKGSSSVQTDTYKKISKSFTLPVYCNRINFVIESDSCRGTLKVKEPMISSEPDIPYVDGYINEQDIDWDYGYIQGIGDTVDRIISNELDQLVIECNTLEILGDEITPSNIISNDNFTSFDFIYNHNSKVDKTKEIICNKLSYSPSLTSNILSEGICHINNGFRLVVKTSSLSSTSEIGLKQWCSVNKLRILFATKVPEYLPVEDDYIIDVITLKGSTYVYARANNDLNISFKIPTNMYAMIENNLDTLEKIEYILDNVVDPYIYGSPQ